MNYIIAATPRTGSNFLCETLLATHVCGKPREYAARADQHQWSNVEGFRSHEAYVRHYLDSGRTPNGVFGTKLMWGQIVAMAYDQKLKIEPTCEDILLTVADLIGPCRYLFLRRKDKLRQAISYYRARATGSWVAEKRDKLIADSQETPVPFDCAAINACMLELESDNASWSAYLSSCGCDTLHLYYEDIVSSTEMWVRRICTFIGEELPAGFEYRPGRLTKQADHLTEQWIDVYQGILGH
jgi:LPS sulfotransferase NodH